MRNKICKSFLEIGISFSFFNFFLDLAKVGSIKNLLKKNQNKCTNDPLKSSIFWLSLAFDAIFSLRITERKKKNVFLLIFISLLPCYLRSSALRFSLYLMIFSPSKIIFGSNIVHNIFIYDKIAIKMSSDRL